MIDVLVGGDVANGYEFWSRRDYDVFRLGEGDTGSVAGRIAEDSVLRMGMDASVASLVICFRPSIRSQVRLANSPEA